ncbi:hypothetical protein LA303_00860 [Candidatus Sulfidibacterium hydrothermale]|uniref:hypothetical protein n=1 Tax=Candidatus Sulfidibacterium hydrothermale TaxID=2875962 RepID=UPI001F0A2300|nr:hypothetical protein [Candidatus Sulfidibacterium hydrothermale]UBM62546.1 hypothetical protein LA303_00860 [Candidatus Sulfidibacterium hydrothermale]
MKNKAKFVFMLIAIIISEITYSQNKVITIGNGHSNKVDSLLINTIKDYQKKIIKDDKNSIITANIRAISKSKLDVTLGYILNDYDLSFYKPSYVFYTDNKTCVLVRADSTAIINYKGNISFKIMTAVLADKIKARLNNSKEGIYSYSPVYWIISYQNGMIKITKNLLKLPPGY